MPFEITLPDTVRDQLSHRLSSGRGEKTGDSFDCCSPAEIRAGTADIDVNYCKLRRF